MSAPGPEHFYPLPARKQPRTIQWPFGIMLFGGALFCLGYCAATVSAAELDPRKRPHDLYLLGKPSEASPDSKTIWRIGAGYIDRADCEDAKRRVRVMKPNGTLQCHEAKQ